jgi:hypothetical protein
VKKRYKTVLEILKQCEMREKAEIVVENDKLKNVSPEDAIMAVFVSNYQ